MRWWSAMVILFVLGGLTPQSGLAQSTPAATAQATLVVADYPDIAGAYASAATPLRNNGRLVVEDFQSGATRALFARLSPELRGVFGEAQIAQILADLTSNRVHFALPEVGAVWNGHLAGDTISGFFVQGGVGGFTLERVRSLMATPAGGTAVATPVNAASLDGTWVGSVQFGSRSLQIQVIFRVEGATIAATIDIPEQGVQARPLSDLFFVASQPIGSRMQEAALPITPTTGIYAASYTWGAAALVFTVALEPSGMVVGFQATPQWPLPPDPMAGYVSPVSYRLPADGVWWVRWGGETEFQNYHATTPAQRHAYDLTIWREGGTFRGDGLQNEDYWCWGVPVTAPAAGTVMKVVNGARDNIPNAFDQATGHPAGNHVVIQTADNEFFLIGHLQQGSVGMSEGQIVNAGDPIGLTGNSGNSSEPHLLVQTLNRADLLEPQALSYPLAFANVTIDGSPVESGMPAQGQFIANGVSS